MYCTFASRYTARTLCTLYAMLSCSRWPGLQRSQDRQCHRTVIRPPHGVQCHPLPVCGIPDRSQKGRDWGKKIITDH